MKYEYYMNEYWKLSVLTAIIQLVPVVIIDKSKENSKWCAYHICENKTWIAINWVGLLAYVAVISDHHTENLQMLLLPILYHHSCLLCYIPDRHHDLYKELLNQVTVILNTINFLLFYRLGLHNINTLHRFQHCLSWLKLNANSDKLASSIRRVLI